jgi:hypothetical protein
MPRVGSLYNPPSFCRMFFTIWAMLCCNLDLLMLFFICFISFSLFGGICSTYPRLISSFSSVSELYALSKHRCWSFLLLPLSVFLVLYDGDGRLTTPLSTTFVTSLISCVLAEEITIDRGIPFLSVKICLFVPSLLLSVGLLPAVLSL